jgi:CheY-like chemotaxis protein
VSPSHGFGPRVLVVDDNASIARLVRIGLETEGCHVVGAGTLEEARLALGDDLVGVVLDRQLPDGDGLSILSEIDLTCPTATVIVHSTKDDGREPDRVTKVGKGDIAAIIDLLGVRDRRIDPRRLAIIDLVQKEIGGLEEDWAELCRWDPMLPPDSVPPMAGEMIAAIGAALEQPQPLAWGPDPAIEDAATAFAEEAGSIDIAIEQLVCLREALVRRLNGRIPPNEYPESHARLHMVVDRALGVAAQAASRKRA